MSFTPSVATQVKRFACDRCHSQKLRCPRPADGDLHKPCVRCCKAGTQCNISTSLRMGRPTKSRKLNTGEGVPSRTSSPTRKPMSNRKSLETSARSESDHEGDEVGNQGSTNASNNWISRCSTVNPKPYNISPIVSTTTPSDMTDPATPIVMNDFLQYLDFDLEFTDAMNTGMYDDSISRLRMHSEKAQRDKVPDQTLPANPSRPRGEELSTDSNIFKPTPFNNPSEEDTLYNFNEFPTSCLGRYSAYPTPPEVASIHASPITVASSIKQPPFTFSTTKPSQKASSPEPNESEYADLQVNKPKSLPSLLQVQQRIYDCSEKIIQRNASHHSHSDALGGLLCATDEFIRLISHISGNGGPPSPSVPVSPPRHSTLTTNADANSKDVLPRKPSAISFDQKETVDSPNQSSALPSGAAFYLIMACHTRILAAYDAVISIVGSAKVTSRQLASISTTGEGCFSIGSFMIQPGTLLESLLYLQVISHQLERLNSALSRCMMMDALSSPLSSRLSLSASKSGSERWRGGEDLQHCAIKMIEQQGTVLKERIKSKIADAQGSLQA